MNPIYHRMAFQIGKTFTPTKQKSKVHVINNEHGELGPKYCCVLRLVEGGSGCCHVAAETLLAITTLLAENYPLFDLLATINVVLC